MKADRGSQQLEEEITERKRQKADGQQTERERCY